MTIDRIADERYYLSDAPLITMLRESQPVARKDYPCMCCSGIIAKGERHSLFVYIDDDSIPRCLRVSRMHFYCPMEAIP